MFRLILTVRLARKWRGKLYIVCLQSYVAYPNCLITILIKWFLRTPPYFEVTCLVVSVTINTIIDAMEALIHHDAKS